MQKTGKYFGIAVFSTLFFLIWTVLVCRVDVSRIGPQDSAVGMSTMNGWFHTLTGEHLVLYDLTDYLEIIPLSICLLFAFIGVMQLIKRKSLAKVDRNIIILGGFYAAVIFCYLLFEYLAINFRPVLIEGILEVSYPSSTTLLVICVMVSSIYEIRNRIEHKKAADLCIAAVWLYTAFMVTARAISGVHWLSDIIGGILLSIILLSLYYLLIGTNK